jgi:hypothetical protein
MSSQVATSLAPCLIRVLGPPGILVGDVARNREDLAILLEGAARRNACAAVLGGFDNQHAHRHAADDAVADRKILRSGECGPAGIG